LANDVYRHQANPATSFAVDPNEEPLGRHEGVFQKENSGSRSLPTPSGQDSLEKKSSIMDGTAGFDFLIDGWTFSSSPDESRGLFHWFKRHIPLPFQANAISVGLILC